MLATLPDENFQNISGGSCKMHYYYYWCYLGRVRGKGRNKCRDCCTRSTFFLKKHQKPGSIRFVFGLIKMSNQSFLLPSSPDSHLSSFFRASSKLSPHNGSVRDPAVFQKNISFHINLT